MKIDGKEYRTIWFENNIVKIIDQTKLPHQFIIKDLKTVKDKEIVVYLFCTGSLKGDDYKRLWNKKKFTEPYKGKPKLEKRLIIIFNNS